MRILNANLRISYIGGGFDYPNYFKSQAMSIIAEGIPFYVRCIFEKHRVTWEEELPDVRGLGSSGARWLSFMRALAPGEHEFTQVQHAIRLESFGKGGWQDPIAASQLGLMKITLQNLAFYKKALDKPPMFDAHRQLYRIPVTHDVPILGEQSQHLSHIHVMAGLVADAEKALRHVNYSWFGRAITTGWNLKKTWHPAIMNREIRLMECRAEAAGAYGYKVCGAGGQGAFLVIATPEVHQELSADWEALL